MTCKNAGFVASAFVTLRPFAQLWLWTAMMTPSPEGFRFCTQAQ